MSVAQHGSQATSVPYDTLALALEWQTHFTLLLNHMATTPRLSPWYGPDLLRASRLTDIRILRICRLPPVGILRICGLKPAENLRFSDTG